MGVGALERDGSCRLSPYTLSRKPEAEKIWASEASVEFKDAINDGCVAGCSVCIPRERYSRSRDNCVSPLCDFDPSIV